MTSLLLRTRSRRARRRFATLAVSVLAVGAASCVQLEELPPVASQYCLTSVPTTPAEYQQAFDGLRTVWTEWAAADGGFPAPLPDGRILWLWGDTVVGRVRPNGSIADPKLIRNSIVVQEGRCFTPYMAGPRGARTDGIASPAPNEWFWPVSSVVENGGTTLRLFMLHMKFVDHGGNGFDFETESVDVATYSLPGTVLQSITPLALPIEPAYGETVVAGLDGYLYAFGHQGAWFSTPAEHYVARVPLGQETNPGAAWEFYNSALFPSWAITPPLATPVLFDSPTGTTPPDGVFNADEGPYAALNVVQYGTQGGVPAYLASAKPVEVFSEEVLTWTSPTPWGPWTYLGKAVGGLPGDPSYDHPFTYGGRILVGSPGAPILTWSQNYNPLGSIYLNHNLYKSLYVAPDPASLPPP